MDVFFARKYLEDYLAKNTQRHWLKEIREIDDDAFIFNLDYLAEGLIYHTWLKVCKEQHRILIYEFGELRYTYPCVIS